MRKEWAVACLATGAAALSIYEVIRLRRIVAAGKTAAADNDRKLSGKSLLAAVELGGTSCRVAVAFADSPTDPISPKEIITDDPRSTIGQIVDYLDSQGPFVAIGVASFGPIDLDPRSETYGYITTTPKPGWQNVDLLGHFKKYNIPIGFDTDVNAPALAELRYGPYQ